MSDVESMVTIVVDVKHPADWDMYDLHDALRFHLGLGDLDSVTVDISAVTIVDSRVQDRHVLPKGTFSDGK